MYQHGPDCLRGPHFRVRAWWIQSTAPVNASLPSLNENTIRWDLVERVRGAIAAGTYETQEKWHVALDNMLTRLGS